MEKTNNELNTTSKTSSEFKRPVKVFRSGMIQASLWENQTKKGLHVIVYDEAGDFNRRGALTKSNAQLNRAFEACRAFKIN